MADNDKPDVPRMPTTPPPPPGPIPPPPPPPTAAEQIRRQSGDTQHSVPAPAYPQMPPPPPASAAGGTQKNWMGITGFVLSLVSLVACCGLPLLSVPAAILGHLGLSAYRRGEATARGLSLAAIIIGWISTLFGLIFWGAAIAESA